MKHRIDKAEFYITNVCNLACPGCNRFNDLKFKGWQAWKDYADIYAQWAEQLDVDHLVILGGEPTMNPSLSEWITGLRALWPKANIQFLTNGMYLRSNHSVYRACLKTKAFIGISVHNPDLDKEIFDQLDEFLVKPFKVNDWKESDNLSKGYQQIIDANDVHVRLVKQSEFMTSARINTPTGYTLHNSDPGKAHNACCHAQYRNYQFVKGRLYKCGPVALFPELDDQFDLELSSEDKQLLRSYTPLSADSLKLVQGSVDDYFADVIPQCKFCPETVTFYPLQPEQVLSKITKKT